MATKIQPMLPKILAVLLFTASVAPAGSPTDAFLDQSVTVAGKERHFRLLTPVTPPDEPPKPAPVVLFLHGAGERGSDNVQQLKHFPVKMAQAEWRTRWRCFLIAPQCEVGKQWVDAPWGDRQPKPMAAEPSEMMQVAMAALDKVKADHQAEIDPARLYVVGLSMGGYGTWELAMRHPGWFAAAAPVCGGGDESKAALIGALPVWTFHGDKDTVVWTERSERMVAAVNKAGGNARITILPGVAHDAWNAAFDPKSGLLDWLFSMKRPPASR